MARLFGLLNCEYGDHISDFGQQSYLKCFSGILKFIYFHLIKYLIFEYSKVWQFGNLARHSWGTLGAQNCISWGTFGAQLGQKVTWAHFGHTWGRCSWGTLGAQLRQKNDLKNSFCKLNTLGAQSYLGHTWGRYSWGPAGAHLGQK